MEDMLKEFVAEAMDLAVNVEEYLLKLEKNLGDMNALSAVFRSFHTIKGGAGFMNIGPVVSACHLTENLFDALRSGRVPVTQAAIDAALEASGFVADQLARLANGVRIEDLRPLPAELERSLLVSIEGQPGQDGKKKESARAAPAEAISMESGTPLRLTPEEHSMQIINWEAYYRAIVPPAAEMPQAASVIALETAERQEAPAEEIKGLVKEDSVRIDSGKLDTLLEVAGESVQATNQAGVLLERLMQHSFDADASELMKKLAETLSRASRYSTELQHATLSARMQPVGRLFQKFPRLVRELARDLGKEVELVIEGADTEVDRVVVEGLYDPLVHMLRNSIDHGIESNEERKAVMKPSRAVIKLAARQHGSSIMIELTDDGRGIDAKVLRARALAKGLISENMAQTEEEALNLIFLPGFSTKEVASSVSGRGVGMDVVRTAVEKHRGFIGIDTQLGKGTRFSIQLPIEMSIVPTMLVSTADVSIGMPISLVERVVELPEEMRCVSGSPVAMDQGRPLSVKSLAGVLGYPQAPESIGIVVNAPVPYILAVASVDGTADLVIKPLTSICARGITGTSRSAEGDLVLILSAPFVLNGCR